MVPISGFVVKIASRCNLNCSYCYEYNMGDDSWKSMPKIMSIETMSKIMDRIKEHSLKHDFNNISISLHGGEPLLVGIDKFRDYINVIKNNLDGYRYTIGMQTNATLIDQEFLTYFEENDIYVGISYDGPPKVNDLNRYYHNGKGSSKDVEVALELLKDSKIFSGILTVIDVNTNPIDTWRYLAQFEPPIIDFLLPHANWDNPPLSHGENNYVKYGDWMISIFDDWFNGYKSHIRIRFFEEILYRLFGQKGSLESLGTEEVGLITISSNGAYEQVDTMKSVYPGAQNIGLNIETNDLDEVLLHKGIKDRQTGKNGLCIKCQNCKVVNICGGGYYPHRYSKILDFDNPSVYCEDLYKLITHIEEAVILNTQKSQIKQ
jgi:uncharacterized protein